MEQILKRQQKTLKLTNQLFEKIRKLDKLLGEQKNRQGLHKIRNERKDSITELIPQKYKGSKDTNTNNYMQANWKHLRNG